MKLIAIILNYNTADLTRKAMDSGVEALSAIDGDWKLLVIDNHSTDDSAAIVNDHIITKKHNATPWWEQVEFIQSPVNGGFGAGNNIGFRRHLESAAEPEYFYILNSDAFPQSDAVKNLLQTLESKPEFGIAGSYIFGTDNSFHGTAFRFPSILGEFEEAISLGFISRLLKNYVVSMGIQEQTTKVDWLAGASMMIRASVLKKIGIFDEEFFLYFEETDLCRRAKQVGWETLYVTESKVAHVGSASTGLKTKTRIPQYWLDSRRHYFQKNHGKAYYYASTIVRIIGEALYRIRIMMEGKQEKNPDFFIRDLFKHTFGLASKPDTQHSKHT